MDVAVPAHAAAITSRSYSEYPYDAHHDRSARKDVLYYSRRSVVSLLDNLHK